MSQLPSGNGEPRSIAGLTLLLAIVEVIDRPQNLLRPSFQFAQIKSMKVFGSR
jgi:hypothetical protein